MPEMFGTHHTKVETLLYERLFSNIQKMLILIRHDSTAQVIIHTANMIAFDWTNMTQAVWKSPHLPLLNKDSVTETSKLIGSGSKFKTDLLNYLRTYDLKRQICKPLIEQLSQHDFSEVRAALIASVPGKQDLDTGIETLWGWPGLRNALKSVPGQNREPEIVVQISSIASIGQSNKWLDQTMFKTLGASKGSILSKPDFRIIFPTADEVRRSLNGYRSGSAIHTKIQTAAQSKQLQYLKPFLNHWAGDGAQHSLNAPKSTSDAGRKRAAPHIKTYIRFSDSNKAQIDWMLVTSANLSKQAWGEASNAAGEVRICSYEVGVLVWPGLFGEKATMVPTFRSDAPKAEQNSGEVIVAARMPYDLPLTPYAKDDVPWCATASYTEPDWMGETYNVG
jgi:tyrosyl-DNA phosphodiesterase-1